MSMEIKVYSYVAWSKVSLHQQNRVGQVDLFVEQASQRMAGELSGQLTIFQLCLINWLFGTYACYLRTVWVYALSAEEPLNSTKLI